MIFNIISVKIYQLISKMKQYYFILQWVYNIIIKELGDTIRINKNTKFQIIIKAVNNIVEPNGFILILLVFAIYSKILESNVLSLILLQ